MNIKQIEAFIKIANNQSFSKTAKEMYLTQPTVSAAIKNLEDELNMSLFVRNTRGVQLTESGKQIYMFAKQMLEAASAIELISSQNKKEAVQRELVVAASSIPASYILPEMMSAFTTRFPETQFRVSVTDSEKVAEDVENHKADIGLCGTAPEGKCFDCIPFYQDELVVVTPNTEKYRKLGERVTLDWILEESVILREEGSGTRTEALRFLKKNGIESERLNITARIGNTSAILNSVRKGLGITFISKLAAQEDLQAGHICAFPLSPEGYRRDLYLVYNSLFPQTETAKRFIKFVKKQYIK